jgi:hypothetical protein
VIAGDTLSVSALANDPEGDSVAMRFAWGDADTSAWSGFTARGCTLKVTHIYAVGGLFTIQVQGKDRRGRVSEWQGGIEVSVLDSALVKWFVDIGYVEYAGPAIAADGTIYVSTYGGAVRSESGRFATMAG